MRLEVVTGTEAVGASEFAGGGVPEGMVLGGMHEGFDAVIVDDVYAFQEALTADNIGTLMREEPMIK